MKLRTKKNKHKAEAIKPYVQVFDFSVLGRKAKQPAKGKLLASGPQGELAGIAPKGYHVANLGMHVHEKNVRVASAKDVRLEHKPKLREEHKGYAIQLDRDNLMLLDGSIVKGRATRRQRGV